MVSARRARAGDVVDVLETLDDRSELRPNAKTYALVRDASGRVGWVSATLIRPA